MTFKEVWEPCATFRGDLCVDFNEYWTACMPLRTFQFTYYDTKNFLFHETEDKFLSDSECLLRKLVHKFQRHLVRVKRFRRRAAT